MTNSIKLAGGLVGSALWIAGCGGMARQPTHHKSPSQVVTVNNTKNPLLSKQPNHAKNKKVTSATKIAVDTKAIARGQTLFSRKCAVCHGVNGVGTQTAPRLEAPSGVASSFQTEISLRTFILEQMPANAPGSLSHQQSRDVTAYVWHIAESK
ncbi:MAG: cytochrome c [Firmicutes bacterium]|nr:cytochrome c [Bacillota bacterium]